MHFILVGVCVLSGYGWAEAADQVDTIEVCYRPGESLSAGIVKENFSGFRAADSSKIIENNTNDYEVNYSVLQLEFTGAGITGTKICSNFDSKICSATSNYEDQIINCTITYLREIHFKKAHIDESYYNSEKAIQKNDLLGDTTGNYPQFKLTSKRKWHTVIRIKKKLMDGEWLDIEGSKCLVDGKTMLSVSEWFKDMNCTWTSIGGKDILSSKTAHEITVTRKDATILETTVTCVISAACDAKDTVSASIKLLPDKTPESTITVAIPGGDCLSTVPAFFGPNTVPVTASNPVSGVKFFWETETMDVQQDNTAQTFNYPIMGYDDFTIGLTTSGGCEETYTSRVVHRKLDNNVVLQVSDSCLTAGVPFRVSTNPPLPKMDLQWITPFGFLQGPMVVIPGNERKDVNVFTKTGVLGQSSAWIDVVDMNCGGTISTEITVSEAYTEMMAIDDNGKILQSGDTVDAGVKEITFTAPQHSSITGDKPYTWSFVRYIPAKGFLKEQFLSTIPLPGTAEYSENAPASGGYLKVTVSYTSCRGKESKEYMIYSR